MGALTIAFDTIVVGALALPWLLIIIHLFFCEGEDGLADALTWVTESGRQAAAGVVLFAITYTLGSAVSRMARDFFNDDDLRLQVDGRLLRVGVTEDRILTSVYCNLDDNHLLRAGAEDPALAAKIGVFQNFPGRKWLCDLNLKWWVRYTYNRKDDDLNEAARDMFGLQEDALMVKGGDFSTRLRQLHDQIMVLRGAALNGVIVFSLCMFAWGQKLRREDHARWVHLAVMTVPAIYIGVAVVATVHHFEESAPIDPPYMEFTLLLLAAVGAWLVWRRPVPPKPVEDRVKESESRKKPKKKCYWQDEHWARLGMLSAILTMAAVLGWWSTEVIYGEQVVYSYDSQGAQK